MATVKKKSASNLRLAAASRPHEHFRKFLQEGQYRITPERFDVLDAVLAWNDHFDADNLFIYLKNNGSKVSRATVYKTLALLHECGLVSRYRFSQGHAQYEKTTDRPHHDHMVCTKCGKIVEFENSRVERLQDDACAQYGFSPMYHSFQIFGLCLECRTPGAFKSTGNDSSPEHPLVIGMPGAHGVLPLKKVKEQRGQ
ncbi:MAG TPA: transcriptional repressor [Candidatus Kapabacteria bacterium]|jgi:Fur family ferric uptake transcriptional regulator